MALTTSPSHIHFTVNEDCRIRSAKSIYKPTKVALDTLLQHHHHTYYIIYHSYYVHTPRHLIFVVKGGRKHTHS